MIELKLLFALSFGEHSRAKKRYFRPPQELLNKEAFLYPPPKEEGLGDG
jgi:hypothetical protein